MSRRKTPAAEVKAFRERHGLTQSDLDGLLGFTSGGMAVYYWERDGAPYYATLIFKLVDELGITLLRELVEKGLTATARTDVQAFRAKHNLRGSDLDRLFGFGSKGRTTRRWEDPLERGAPSYVTILMAYCNAYGTDVLEELAKAGEPA